MAKNTNKPVITHIEILSYAIQHLDAEINRWKDAPIDTSSIIEPLIQKRNAIITIYNMETGSQYE